MNAAEFIGIVIAVVAVAVSVGAIFGENIRAYFSRKNILVTFTACELPREVSGMLRSFFQKSIDNSAHVVGSNVASIKIYNLGNSTQPGIEIRALFEYDICIYYNGIFSVLNNKRPAFLSDNIIPLDSQTIFVFYSFTNAADEIAVLQNGSRVYPADEAKSFSDGSRRHPFQTQFRIVLSLMTILALMQAVALALRLWGR